MIKKYSFIGFLIFGFSSNSLAETLNIDFLKGLYGGVGVAGNAFQFNSKYSFNPNIVVDTNFYDRSYNFTATNFSPNVIMGYGRNFNKYYLGIEARYNIYNFSTSYNANVSTVNHFTIRSSYNLNVKAGYQILSKTIGYGLLGGVITQLQRNTQFNPNGAFSPIDIASVSQSRNVSGVLLGAGIEQVITDHVHVAAEYNHVFYGDTSFSLQHAIFKFLGNIGENKINLSQDAVMLKILYYV